MSCRVFGLLPILSLHTLSFIKLSHSFCNVTEINLSLSSSMLNPFIPIHRWTDFSPFTNPNPAVSASLFLASPTSHHQLWLLGVLLPCPHSSPSSCWRATGSSNTTKGKRCKKKVWASFQKKSLSWAPSAFPLTPSSLALTAQGPRLLYPVPVLVLGEHRACSVWLRYKYLPALNTMFTSWADAHRLPPQTHTKAWEVCCSLGYAVVVQLSKYSRALGSTVLVSSHHSN